MPYISILLTLVLISCQSTAKQPQSSLPAPSTAAKEVEDPPMELKNRLRGWNQARIAELSRPIVNLLMQGKLMGPNQDVQLLDVFCQISAEKDEVVSKCSFLKKVGKKWQSMTLRGEIAEELRLELSRFPVSQGESGVSVSYLRCRNRNAEPACELAFDLNYEGP